jgi:hypothetical protein
MSVLNILRSINWLILVKTGLFTVRSLNDVNEIDFTYMVLYNYRVIYTIATEEN